MNVGVVVSSVNQNNRCIIVSESNVPVLFELCDVQSRRGRSGKGSVWIDIHTYAELPDQLTDSLISYTSSHNMIVQQILIQYLAVK